MQEIGIIADEKGGHIAVGDPFVYILKRHGMRFDESAMTNSKGLILVPSSEPIPQRCLKHLEKPWEKQMPMPVLVNTTA